MKNNLCIASLIILFITGCKKADYIDETLPDRNEQYDVPAEISWLLVNDEKNTYATQINTSSINEEIVRNGLVIVYHISNNHTKSLPFQEFKDGRNYSLIYSVANSRISIYMTPEAGIPPNDMHFDFIVINPSDLKKLEASGITRDKIFELPPAEIRERL